MAISVHKFRVEGISALLMNNPAGMSSETGVKSQKDKLTGRDQAETKAYRGEGGQLVAPSTWFRGALLSGCKGKKIGKHFATSMVKAGVFTAEEECPLFNPETGEPIEDFEVFTTTVVIQKNRVPCSRPRIWPWAVDVAFEIDDDFVAEKHVRDLLNIGGRIAGVGDWRPEKSGKYGRFSVV